ncbi:MULTISPECIES: stage III sporulation protein AF [Paenibacillus]|uniref:stage III sporulation protein AF n=1 Tax=Paenibacillus TaxID=44249 RepID=UPI00203E9D14|nr:stage III sporulation protein AF [Paenibacillus camelliae]
MLAWLGEWLSSIVVVVLLAIVVELVLPNSKMLRYSRLVVGLILMLTMLNPILQIFQSDFHDKLTASFSLWEKSLASRERAIPSIDEITKQAEQLKEVRQEAAVDMTRSSLEQAILQEIRTKTEAKVEAVNLEFGWDKKLDGQQVPHIASVTVKLKMTADQQQHAEQRDSEKEEVIVDAINEVSIPVVSVELNEQEADHNSAASSEQVLQDGLNNEQLSALFNVQAHEIRQIITAGWNVKADHVFVQAS